MRYDVHETPPIGEWVPLALQHLFAMFGATILVPILTGLNPSIALMTSGLGTLTFIAITKGRIPAYLGSSFAFIAPLLAVQAQFGPGEWIPAAMGGTIAVGVLYAVAAWIVSIAGSDWLDRVFPPVVIGSVIIVIGLSLAPTGIQMAGLCAGEACGKEFVSLFQQDVIISLITLAVVVVFSIFVGGFLGVIPILFGVVIGYLVAAVMGAVDFSGVAQAPWIGVPWADTGLVVPRFHAAALSLLVPVGLVTLAEHLGDVFVISRVVGREYIKDPGLKRTILGDGIASGIAGIFGGPPNTTYGENVGVLAITRVYSVKVVALAAIFAVALAFVPKLGALLQSIPEAVMGGVVMVLFGIIASSGIRTLVESGIDFADKRNLVIASIILVLGIGNARLDFGVFVISGMALATVVGIILNLILPFSTEEGRQPGEEGR